MLVQDLGLWTLSRPSGLSSPLCWVWCESERGFLFKACRLAFKETCNFLITNPPPRMAVVSHFVVDFDGVVTVGRWMPSPTGFLVGGLVLPVPAPPQGPPESQLEPDDSSAASQPCITGRLRPLPSAAFGHQGAMPSWLNVESLSKLYLLPQNIFSVSQRQVPRVLDSSQGLPSVHWCEGSMRAGSQPVFLSCVPAPEQSPEGSRESALCARKRNPQGWKRGSMPPS